ncbi:MAG: hypothetical protein DRN95_09350, partial [Candidatus Hydrothermarchaeota archaeon]
APYPRKRAHRGIIKNVIPEKYAGIYCVNAFYPEKHVEILSTGRMHQYKIAGIAYYPFRYNPVTGKLIKASRGKIVVDYRQDCPIKSNAIIPYHISQRIKRIVSNFDDFEGTYSRELKKTGNPKYIIMATEKIVSNSQALNAFITSKENRGFDVQLVTDSIWGGGTGDSAAVNIRKWLKDNYENLAIEYVLLIGSPHPLNGDVAMKTCDTDKPADLYLSDLSGTWDGNSNGVCGEWADYESGDPDKYAEVHVGRIPLYTTDYSVLDKILNKIIAYENAQSDSIAWRWKMIIPMEPCDEQTPGNWIGEAVKKDACEAAGWDYHRIYDFADPGPPESMPTDYATVLDVWTGDTFGACMWNTHGFAADALGIMNLANAAKLNDRFPTSIFQCSCWNAKPSALNNLASALLNNGAIMTVAGTIPTMYMPGQKVFDNATDESIGVNYTIATVADSMTSGQALDYVHAKFDPTGWWENYLAYVLYGDPSISVYTHSNITQTKEKMTSNVSDNYKLKIEGSKIVCTFPSSAIKKNASLVVYNLQGKKLCTLIDGQVKGGTYIFNLKNNTAFADGIYLCILKCGAYINTSKFSTIYQLNKRL